DSVETVALGLPSGASYWAIRCNLITVKDGFMHDFTAGHINNADGARLMATVHEKLGGAIDGASLDIHACVAYDHILLYRPEGKAAPFAPETKSQPPHDIPDKPAADYLP